MIFFFTYNLLFFRYNFQQKLVYNLYLYNRQRVKMLIWKENKVSVLKLVAENAL